MNKVKPAPVAAPPVCYHCGADCQPLHLRREDLNFCCEGCYTVFGIIRETGLKGYYELNDNPGATGKPVEAGKYAFLEDESVVEQMLEFRNGNLCKVTFTAPDIHCSSCIWLLERLHKFREGVIKSEVNFGKKEIYLTYNKEKISLRQVAELLAAIGYQPELSLARLEGNQQSRPDRSLWYKIGVAGFAFGNIMLLSFPEYFGLEDLQFTRIFGFLNIILSLPILLYSGIDYFRSAWAGLSKRHINIDVPISLGISVLFLRSLAEIILETGPGYLDSMAGLVFFLLLGKWFQRKTYDFLSFERDYKSYFPISVTRLVRQQEEQIPLSKLKPGDRLLIRSGELIPADGLLLKGQGSIDYSFVSGESDLMAREPGELLYAGGRQERGAIEVEIVKEVSQSYLTRLWNNEVFRKEEQDELGKLTGKVSKYFTLIVILIALISGGIWLVYDAGMALQVFTAVLIVACPCALALATPFTLGTVIRVFSRNGFFLKSPSVVEAIAGADAWVFDKTGTLTQTGSSEVNYEGDPLQADEITALCSLLRQSRHPLSRRLYAELPESGMQLVSDFEEFGGKGIKGEAGGVKLQVGSADFVGATSRLPNAGSVQREGSEVWVRTGDRIRGHFRVEHPYREGISEMVGGLEGQDLWILSGDNEREEALLKTVFPPGTAMHFRQSPEDKLRFIRDLRAEGRSVVMVGDGLNDSGALKQSDVGISIAEDVSAFTPASDAILSGQAVRRLGDFLSFSRTGIRVIKASFALSFLYNLIGLSFAVTGNLSPLVAAILMPLSSVTIIAFTTLLTQYLAHKKGL